MDLESSTAPAMLAARWHGRLDIQIEQVPVPDPSDDEALVRVLWVGLCGSDLEEYVDGPIVIPGPVTLGHEIVGTVAVPARDGSGPPAGVVVVVDVVTGCGDCHWCQRHEEGQCPRLRVTGLDVDGGLAEFVVGKARRLVAVPAGLDPMHAALAEPLAVAVRAVRKLGSVQGRGGIVVGGGTIGLLVAQVLRHAGASPVVIVEPSDERRAVAARLDLLTCWAETEMSRTAETAPMFMTRGVDFVVECSGADGAAGEAIRRTRCGGSTVLLSVTASRQSIDTTDAVLGEKTILGSAAHMWDDDVVPAVALLARHVVDIQPLITHTVPLADSQVAFSVLADRSQHALKILIDARGDSTASVDIPLSIEDRPQ